MNLKETRASFVLLALLWLPAGILLSSVIRFGPRILDTDSLLMLAVTAPCGLFLAYPCASLHRLGWKRTAWGTFLVLAPLSVLFVLVAGLLGPLGIVVYAAALSLPAWLLYGVFRYRQKHP